MRRKKALKTLLAFVLMFGILTTDSSIFFASAEEEKTLETQPKEVGNNEEVEGAEQDSENTVNEIVGNTRADTRLSANYDGVCMGGGWDKDSSGNPNQTGKKNQNPDQTKKYWDYSANKPFDTLLNEQELIDKYWPKSGVASGKDRIYDAVLEPTYDCYYANVNNGYGESVSQNRASYTKYNADWTQKISAWLPTSTPRARSDQPNNTKFTGNYLWQVGNWQNPFTIVTRPILAFDSKTDFYVSESGSRRRMPTVYNLTGGTTVITDTTKNLYLFKAAEGSGSISYENQYPYTPGKYDVTAQTYPNVNNFELPGRITKRINVMKKGYKVTFQKNVDGQTSVMNENADWTSNNKPSEPDKQMKDLFGTSLYLEQQQYTIPVPQYDTNDYIFEGWQVTEQYVTDDYQLQTKTTNLTDSDQDGRYEYTPTKIGPNAFYVLETTITAKIRSRKTDTITANTQVVGGDKIDAGILVAPSSIKLTEGVTNTESFTATVNTGYAYNFIGWSYQQNGSHNDLGSASTYKPNTDFGRQTETHKDSTLYATFTPKTYTITFDANGGENSSDDSTTTTQSATYYNDVQLQKNPFVKEGFRFKGWSTSKDSSDVTYGNQATARNIPLGGLDHAENNNIPTDVTLYAVWERDIAGVTIEKYKDTLWIENSGWPASAVSSNVYVSSSSAGYNAYELTRYYLDIDMKDLNTTPDKLDKSKFYVVWERSTNGGNSYEKIDINEYGTFITKAFSDQKRDYSKVVYDAEKGKWFVPLLVRANYGKDASQIEGLYRVSVAYDDPSATERVTTEEDFYKGNGTKGWTTSENTEVKVIKTFETVVSIPASVTLENQTEKNKDGTTKEVIKSVHDSNKVTVNPVQHSLTSKTDYDWSTPNTAMDGSTTPSNSYNGGQYSEYTKQKPFKVSVEWSGTLKDSTNTYTISNINMYSASDVGDMKKDQQISTNKEASFSYDGSEQNKTLFDFYLKGDKPENLPHGITYEGIIHFKFANIG